MKKLILTSFLVFGLSSPLSAQDVSPRHGIAMHGDVKYKQGYTHFDYTNPDAPKGGTLKLSAPGTFDSLNPYIVKGSPAAGLRFLGSSFLTESLMEQAHDEPFSMYGLIAETIELPEDRSWVAFNINPKAAWHDGQKITAEDVVWTFNTFLEKGTPFFKAYYGDVKTVVATSKQRVKFTFKHNDNAELPLIISQLPVLPKHYWTADGNDFSSTTLKPPLGSGPYKITKIDAGRSITYKKVDSWWGETLPMNKGRYNFDTITYDYYRDDNVALEAFFSGEFDVRQENTSKLWENGYNVPAVKNGEIIKAEIKNGRPAGMQGFTMNIRRPIFQDITLRKALSYAFDFDWSNKQFAFGKYVRTDSYFDNSPLASSGLPQGRELEILTSYKGKISEEIFTTAYQPPKTDGSGNNRMNLRTAMTMLDDAGYKLAKDGIRVHETTGQRLSFEIIDSNPAFERWVLPFVQNLKKIGVESNFRIVDSAQYQNRMNNFDYDMTIASFGQSESPGNEQRDFWGSQKADMQGSRNYIGVKDAVIDELIELIINAPSREELEYRTRALDRILLHSHYVIPQWHYNKWRIAHSNKVAYPKILSPITPGISDTWWKKTSAE
jgi:microcin C transport system substrate-binding protein